MREKVRVLVLINGFLIKKECILLLKHRNVILKLLEFYDIIFLFILEKFEFIKVESDYKFIIF